MSFMDSVLKRYPPDGFGQTEETMEDNITAPVRQDYRNTCLAGASVIV